MKTQPERPPESPDALLTRFASQSLPLKALSDWLDSKPSDRAQTGNECFGGDQQSAAKERKTALQEGWTLDDFNRLQSHVVTNMNEAGAYVGGDQAAYQRFVALSEKRSAMGCVDTARNEKEDALAEIGERRDYAAAVAFDPEADWQ